MKLTLKRKTLYEEIWSTPKKKLSKKYGISYHRLTRACEKLNIPTPPLGYWKMLKHNKKVTKIPLPQRGPSTYVLEQKDSIERDMQELLPKKVKPFMVKKYLRNPHPLVKRTYNNLKNMKVNRYKRVKAFREGLLDVSVGPKNLKRALRIMDAIIRELERQEFDLKTEHNYKSSNLYVSIDKAKLYLRIREKSYRVTNEPDESGGYNWKHPKFEHFPDGKLRLEIATFHSGDPDKVIRDTKKKTLESQLDKFFPYFLHVAQKEQKHIEKLEAQRRRWKRQRKLNEEAQKQHYEEHERLQILENNAEAYTKSEYIYDLISQIKKKQAELELTKEEELKLKAWLFWSTNHADRLNPINKILKSILE